MKTLFKIGEIAELFHLNIKTLRYYDEIGLVKPEVVDPETGYRYYSWSGNLTTENPDMAEELEDELGVDASTLNNKWLDGDYEDSGTAAIGTSFWIYAKNPGTVTFTKPQ